MTNDNQFQLHTIHPVEKKFVLDQYLSDTKAISS